MERRAVRLGDVIDDYCTRCRLIMNHGVVGMVGDQVRKVRCNTCLSEHAYKHARIPARRRRETAKLFEEVLRGMKGPGEAAVPEGPADTPEVPGPQEGSGSPERSGPPDVPEAPEDHEANEEGPPQPAPRQARHRRLYTIRRSLQDRDPDKGRKKP